VNAPSDAPRPPGVPFLDFSREYSEIGPDVLAAVSDVLSSQRYVLGPQVGRFEELAAAYCRAHGAIGCGSGTDALWLALAALEVPTGAHVLTTPFTFFATASAILRAGARPVFADIDPATYNLSPAAARSVFAKDPAIRAILPVHLYGQCADMDAFRAMARERSAGIVEDAAQAFGAQWDGRPAGSLGDAGAFSFYPTKNLSAAGEAGMVTAMDETTAERARMLRAHGMRRRYYHDELGWNSRLDTLQAAILLVKLQHIEEWNARRRELGLRYDVLFSKAGLAETGPYPLDGTVLPKTDPRATHVFHQYVIRVARRDALRAHLAERHIGTEIYYPVPLHLQKALVPLGYRSGDFPESERAAREVLALPIFPHLREEEQDAVVDAIAGFLS
jgi:dTDP-4-amino-4,6-dideoxygalactose transaminase